MFFSIIFYYHNKYQFFERDTNQQDFEIVEVVGRVSETQKFQINNLALLRLKAYFPCA